VLGLLSELHGTGRTLVLITHEEEIAATAGRKIRMRDGYAGEPLETYR